MRYYRDFVKDAAAAIPGIETSALYKEWVSLSVVGATLQRRVFYNQGRYLCKPNMFIVLIGHPGTGKGTAIRMMYSEVFNKLCSPVFGDDADKLAAESVFKYYLKKDCQLLPRHMLRGKTTFADLVNNLPTFSDGVMINGKMIPGCSIAIVTAEFGVFMSKWDKDLQNLLTEAWDSEDIYEKGTKGYGRDTVKGPCISWLACATPHGFVDDMPPDADEQGLLSRIIPVVDLDEPGIELVKEPGLDDEVVKSFAKDLGDIASISGEYLWTDEAAELVTAWLKGGKQPLCPDALMRNYNTRRYPHLQKMCMAYAAGRRNELVMTAEDWTSATELLFETEKRMPLILRRFAMSEAGKLADDLVELVDYQKKVSIRSLKRTAARTAKSMSDVDKVIQILIDCGAINREGDLITPGTGL